MQSLPNCGTLQTVRAETVTTDVAVYWTADLTGKQTTDVVEGQRVNLATEVVVFNPTGQQDCNSQMPPGDMAYFRDSHRGSISASHAKDGSHEPHPCPCLARNSPQHALLNSMRP